MKIIEKTFTNKYVLIFMMPVLAVFLNCIMYCCGDSPSRVYVTGKKHIPYESGDGATFTNEQWLLYVQRIDGTDFYFYSKERIVSTDKESYYKLKVGDTLKNEY
jgi:NADH:ubiquinone oxidoreductase subunit 3 (subunit A)